MKYLAILGIVIALGIGGYILKSNESVTYIAPEKEVVTEEVVVNELDKRIADAQAAAMNDIETKAQAAYDALVAQELLKVEHNVTKAYREEVEARETDLSKEIGVYWRDRRNVIQLIKETFHEDPQTAVAIAACESGFNPNAYNDKNYNGTVDSGIFQINSTHYGRMDELGLDPWNVEDNVAFARLLYEENGYLPWVCYTKNMLVMR